MLKIGPSIWMRGRGLCGCRVVTSSGGKGDGRSAEDICIEILRNIERVLCVYKALCIELLKDQVNRLSVFEVLYE